MIMQTTGTWAPSLMPPFLPEAQPRHQLTWHRAFRTCSRGQEGHACKRLGHDMLGRECRQLLLQALRLSRKRGRPLPCAAKLVANHACVASHARRGSHVEIRLVGVVAQVGDVGADCVCNSRSLLEQTVKQAFRSLHLAAKRCRHVRGPAGWQETIQASGSPAAQRHQTRRLPQSPAPASW